MAIGPESIITIILQVEQGTTRPVAAMNALATMGVDSRTLDMIGQLAVMREDVEVSTAASEADTTLSDDEHPAWAGKSAVWITHVADRQIRGNVDSGQSMNTLQSPRYRPFLTHQLPAPPMHRVVPIMAEDRDRILSRYSRKGSKRLYHRVRLGLRGWVVWGFVAVLGALVGLGLALLLGGVR